MIQSRQSLAGGLQQFSSRPLPDAALALWKTLGYSSERRLDLPTDAAGFAHAFAIQNKLRFERALTDQWQSIHFLFQLTGEEISAQNTLFGGGTDKESIKQEEKSYLFFAVELEPGHYARGKLAQIARELNTPFASPILLLLKNGSALTLAVVDRRAHKKDATREVLEKVTLIKDINFAEPHAAHLRILEELELSKLRASDWAQLHAEWRRVLDLSELNKRFFKELSDWYFWARDVAKFPSAQSEQDRSVAVIRLITRAIFVYFIKERGLVPKEFFEPRDIPALLKDIAPDKGTYYNAVMQNLFFASLNAEDGARGWQDDVRTFNGKSESFGDATKRRYREMFRDDKQAAQLFQRVPFLNGGLFECQDDKTTSPECLFDGFSSKEQKRAKVPNTLFFGGEQSVNLNPAYGTVNKRYSVRPLLEILNRYKFTVTENTPIEEEVALDPELLGKVFENLLASYNPETASTARKQTGSFYTPREIVDYMVEESLVAYLETAVETIDTARLRALVTYDLTDDAVFSDAERRQLIAAVGRVTVLDPACGSGAFPMGMLHRLTHVLRCLDPGNVLWKAEQQKQINALDIAEVREAAQKRFEEAVERDGGDYVRKLYLIERSLFGVDIQPIAVQIAKLRFFISLVVEQKLDDDHPARGIQPLPNLETKVVAANTLIKPDAEAALGNLFVTQELQALSDVRRRHFSARKWSDKKKLREKDAKLRSELEGVLGQQGVKDDTARMMVAWNPYDQNAVAPFFDSEWMFGPELKEGFDIVIGNPPYIKEYTHKQAFDGLRTSPYYQGKMDLWYLFVCHLSEALKPNTGFLTFIATNNWTTNSGASKLREKIVNDFQVCQFLDFGNYKVFESADIQTMVFLLKRCSKAQAYQFDYRHLTAAKASFQDVLTLLLRNETAQALYMNPTVERAKIADANFVFSLSGIEDVLKRVKEKSNFNLGDKDIAQGIVPNPDVLSAKSLGKIPLRKRQEHDVRVGDGIFVVEKGFFPNLTATEKKYIKPLYEPSNLKRFVMPPSAQKEIIYLTKKNSKPNLSNLIAHLSKYKEVMNESGKTRQGKSSFITCIGRGMNHSLNLGQKF